MYPVDTAAGQRFRIEQYLPALSAAGFEIHQMPFWDRKTYEILYKPGQLLKKALGTIKGLWRRAQLLRRLDHYDCAFVHLQASPIGPAFLEKALQRKGIPFVYDIDDAIFLAKTSDFNKVASIGRKGAKVANITKMASAVTVVNSFVETWARQHNSAVTRIPTTIDPNYHKPLPNQKSALPAQPVVIGWTGTFSTLRYLDVVHEALMALSKERDFTLRIICNAEPALKGLHNVEFVPWRKETEIADLMPFDIGIMPVADELWARGKVGFKAIQYGALEIPSVVSDVGCGRDVVEDGKTGFVVDNTQEAWVNALRTLIDDPNLRHQMGVEARRKILREYSVPACQDRLVGLFHTLHAN